MHDADSRLLDKVIFRIDSAAVVGPFRHGHPELIDARRQIDELLRRHRDWQLMLVARESNQHAHHLAKRPLRKDQ
jgi:hypothetical protein